MFTNKLKYLNTYSAFVGIMFSLPLFYLLYRAGNSWLETNQNLERFSEEIFKPTINTILLATAVSVGSAIIGTYTAWIISRTDIKYKRLLSALLILPLAIPTYVGALAYIGSLNPNGGIISNAAELIGLDISTRLRGFWPAWFVLTMFTYPYVFMIVRARLARMRHSLEESGRLLGSTATRVFFKITLPQLYPAIISGSLLVFLYCLSEYGAVSLLGYDTLTRVIYTSFLTNTFVSSSGSIILAIVAIAVIAVERRRGIQQKNEEKIEFQHEKLNTLGKLKILAYGSLGLIIITSLVVPLSTFVYWTWRGIAQANIDISETLWLTTATILTGSLAGVITMFVIVPVAQVTLHSKKISARFTRVSVLAGYATPGVVIALAIVFWNLKIPGFGWLYQSYLMLLFAYVIHFGSVGLGSAETALKAVPDSLKESARLLNSSNIDRWIKIHLPLMKPGVLSGVGLVMLATVKELPATLKLAPTGFFTLATDIFLASGEGFDARTGLLSIILIAVSAILIWLLVLRNSED